MLSAETGVIYQVQWNDWYSGPGDKTGDVEVFAYQGSDGIRLFREDSGYFASDLKFIAVSSPDVIYLRIAGYDRETTGNYALRYYTLPPQDGPFVSVKGNPKPAAVIWFYEPGATGYTVYRADAEDGTYTPIGTEAEYGITYRYYIDTGVAPETTYWYKVSAFNNIGEGPLSAAVSFTIPAPGAVTALAHDTWTDGEIGGPLEITWYKFTAMTDGHCTLEWDDAYTSPGSKTARIELSAFRDDDGTPLFNGIDSGGSTFPATISVRSGETIYVGIESYRSYTGTYAIRYY
jgi:hypothetical protein